MNYRIFKAILIGFLGCLWATSVLAGYDQSSVLVQHRDGRLSTEVVAEGQTVATTIAQWEKRPDIAYAEPNALYQSAIIPNDFYWSEQWHLKRIKANLAWETIHNSPDVVVAIIDSGCQLEHPDLKNNWWINLGEIKDNGLDDDRNGYVDDYYGYDFVNRQAEPTPKFLGELTADGLTHGTVVAGVLGAAGNNLIGVSGVTWQVQMMCLKAMNDKGEANAGKVVEAIDYAVRQGAQIINLSFIGSSYSRSLETAIAKAYAVGVIVVAAGGNDLGGGHGKNLDVEPMYPVCYDGANGENMVIGVAATGPLDEKLPFSGYGRKCIDITAPGNSIFSTSLRNPDFKAGNLNLNNWFDGYWSGTSLAAPMVAGTLALMLQANPGLTPTEAKRILLSTADNIHISNLSYINLLGRGRLNVEAAVKEAAAQKGRQAWRLVVANYREPGWVKVVATAEGSGLQFEAFKKTMVNLAVGDLDGDGQAEIIVAPAANAKPEAKIYNREGKLLKTWLVGDPTYRGGLSLAAADINADGRDELIVGPLGAVKPEIKTFAWPGRLIGKFNAFAANFRGGVEVAAGQLDGLGAAEIAVVPAVKGGPQVRVFDGRGNLRGQFFAFDPTWRGGWHVAIAQGYSAWRRSGLLMVSAAKGGGPYVYSFDSRFRLVAKIEAFDSKFSGGVRTVAADISGDGLPEIITATDKGATPNIAIYQVEGKLIKSFFVGETTARNGAALAILPL